jgi:hypothetical protein
MEAEKIAGFIALTWLIVAVLLMARLNRKGRELAAMFEMRHPAAYERFGRPLPGFFHGARVRRFARFVAQREYADLGDPALSERFDDYRRSERRHLIAFLSSMVVVFLMSLSVRYAPWQDVATTRDSREAVSPRPPSTGTEKRMTEQYEASMNFDLENVAPFLQRLNANLSLGLDVPSLAQFTAQTELEDERSVVVTANFDGDPVELEYRVFMDDVDAPDLYFFTPQESLAEAIGAQLDAFADELGI